MKKRTTYIIITLLYMLIISYLSLKPIPQGYHSNIARQAVFNFLHIPIYGLLFYLILHSFSNDSIKNYIYSFAIATLFGIINECLQSLVPGRCASVGDALINTAGVLIAIVACRAKSLEFIKA